MEKVYIYTYRYMWRVVGSDSVYFKVVTDTVEGLEQFENVLKSTVGILSIAREYLHEIDCSRMGVFEKILEVDPDETPVG